MSDEAVADGAGAGSGEDADSAAALTAAYLAHLRVERRLAERTLSLYGDALRDLAVRAAAAGIELVRVQPQQVRRWAAQLHGAGLGPRSIALMLSSWRGFYRWLGRAGAVAMNPVAGVRAPKAARPLPKALAVDQAVALAEHRTSGERVASAEGRALEARDRAIVELLYGAGLRIGELVALDARPGPSARGWIDLQAGEAHVLGKGGKRRSVPVGAAALAALAGWLAERDALAGGGDQPALLVGRHGTRLTAAQIRSRLAARALQAGVSSHVHPHMLRHSFASHLLQSSGDLRAVQEMLGHAQVSTTQVYTRLDFQHLARAYDTAHPRAKRRPPGG